MPNRILREGILTSSRVNSLNWEEECFYRRLMSVVDDYGRFEAHASLLRASLYPLKLDKIREVNVERLISACVDARLIRVYTVGGKRYLELADFKQQTRSQSKCPDAPDTQMLVHCVADAMHPQSNDTPMIANAHLGVCVVGDVVGDVVDGGPRKRGADRPKAVNEVLEYFKANGSTEAEAQTFFDHFEANGWKQGGRAPIKDWRAAARGWLRRSATFAAGLGGRGKNLVSGGSGSDEKRFTVGDDGKVVPA